MPAAIVRVLGSFSFALPAVHLNFSATPSYGALAADATLKEKHNRLPASLQLSASLHGFHFNVNTSDPSDEMHQKWLGTCGIKGHKSNRSVGNSMRSSLADRFRRPDRRGRATLVEHRRAFVLDVGLASFEAHCGVDGQPPDKGSELLFIGDASFVARSTWTPFGMYPSVRDGENAASLYFQGDPNEQSLVAEAAVGQLRGSTNIDQVAALLAYVSFLKAERAATHSRRGISDPRPPPERVHFHHLPKMALAVEVHDVSYQVNAEKGGSDSMKRSLCIELPQFTAAFHGGYHDVYLGRPEAERKAAWKALREDKLDWCIATKYKSGVGVVCSPQKSDDAPQVSGAQNAPAKKPSNEPMTMEEALQRMKELQITDGKEDGDSPPWAAQKSSASTKAQPPRRLGFARKLSSHSGSDTNLRYHFESSCSLDIFEIYLNLSGEGGGARGISARRRDLRESATRHHVVALRSFEATVIGDVPGFTDPTTDVARLRGSQRTLEVRCSLEDVDVEMWHKAAIETCAHLADVLAKAKTPVDPAMFGTEPKAPTPASQAKDDEPVDIIDKCPTGLAFHVSIGAVIAHLGGPDENCDVHLSRGVGFESKRVVLEYAQRGGSQEKLPHAKLGWGARSALELPEDIRLQADALAARDGKAAVGKISLYEIGLFPILDAAQATRQHLDGTAEQASGDAKREQKAPVRKETPVSPALFSPAVWDFQKLKHQISRTKTSRKRFRQQDRGNFIFWMPYSSTKVTIRPPGAVSTKVGKTADEITIATEQTPLLAFKIELLHTYCLLLAFATLKGMRPKARRPRAEPARQQPQDHPVPAKSKPSFHASFDINDVHVSIALPHDVNLFVHLRRLNFRSTRSEGLSVSWESLMTAVESPKVPATGLWEEAVRLRDWKVTVGSKPEGGEPRTIDVNGDGASVRIPFGYVVNRIIDNASVSFKATKQLVHQFVKGNSDSIIEPLAEEPKRLPTISVNLRILTIEAQDDPMETKLNIIWRAGGDEQRARAERDAAFEAKVGAISAEENSKSKTSLDTRATESIYDVESIVDPAQSQTETYGWPGNPSAKHNVTIDEARERLDTFNSSSWIRRYANAKAEQGRREDVVVRRIHGRYPQHRQPSELPIKMASPTRAAPLIRASFSRVSVDVSRTSFPESKLRDFIHEQGGGIPKDTPFSLMVPMHMLWRMSEWRIELRDYPLPLLHVPPTHSNQPDHLKSWEFEADFCIAEQLGGEESIRHVPVVVVPQATGHPEATEYGMLIPKVAMPVKFYGSPTVKIHSSYPTRFVWGQSIQPTIQDVQRVFDGVTSPPHDPSPRIGFWDKLPLVMHGRFRVQFCGEGDMHLYLKGSRDPYQILGHGAGFVKCWRGAVELRINFPNEDREFFQIISDEYLLAIPDLKDYIDSAATGIASDIKADDSDKKSYDPSFGSSAKRYTKEPDFRKICIKLSNGVRWGAGLRFERTCDDDTCERTPKCSGSPFHRECRFFDFKPHWEVITKTREHFAKIPESERVRPNFRWRGASFFHLYEWLTLAFPARSCTIAEGFLSRLAVKPHPFLTIDLFAKRRARRLWRTSQRKRRP